MSDHAAGRMLEDENVILNYLCGLNIGNITKGTEPITNGYDVSLIISETFVKTGAAPLVFLSSGWNPVV